MQAMVYRTPSASTTLVTSVVRDVTWWVCAGVEVVWQFAVAVVVLPTIVPVPTQFVVGPPWGRIRGGSFAGLACGGNRTNHERFFIAVLPETGKDHCQQEGEMGAAFS